MTNLSNQSRSKFTGVFAGLTISVVAQTARAQGNASLSLEARLRAEPARASVMPKTPWETPAAATRIASKESQVGGADLSGLRLPNPQNSTPSTEAQFRKLMERPVGVSHVDDSCWTEANTRKPANLTRMQEMALDQRLGEDGVEFIRNDGKCEQPTFTYRAPVSEGGWKHLTVSSDAAGNVDLTSIWGPGSTLIVDSTSKEFGVTGEGAQRNRSLGVEWDYGAKLGGARELLPFRLCDERIYPSGRAWQHCIGGNLVSVEAEVSYDGNRFQLGLGATGPSLFNEHRFSGVPVKHDSGWVQPNITVRGDIGIGFSIDSRSRGIGRRSFGTSIGFDSLELGELKN